MAAIARGRLTFLTLLASTSLTMEELARLPAQGHHQDALTLIRLTIAPIGKIKGIASPPAITTRICRHIVATLVASEMPWSEHWWTESLR